jgi:hypothetical protein
VSGTALEAAPVPGAPVEPGRSRWAADTASWIPTWGLISTKLMELRKRRGLMIAVVLLVLGLPGLIMGIRLLFHAFDPKSYGPAGSPDMFELLSNLIASFGFIMAATVGTTAGTTDLTEGVFRQLVVTGRSRLALYLSRIPAGLAILLPLVAVTFGLVCLVTSYAGTANPSTVNVNAADVPVGLSEAQLEHWILGHVQQVFPPGSQIVTPQGGTVSVKGPGPKAHDIAQIRAQIRQNIGSLYSQYRLAEISGLNPPINEMVKIGLWLELYIGIGFVVGLGLGSLMGQRTVSTILMIALEILITPILAAHQIPYFINGQRLIVGIAMDQLRPIGLASATNGPGGPRGAFGGGGALGIPPMPEWAMIAVIVGWIVGWTVIGAWRMMTRDA